MIKKLSEIIQAAQTTGARKTIAVAVAQDVDVLLAVKHANELGIADAILVGDDAAIRRVAQDNQIEIGAFPIIDVSDSAEACRMAVRLVADGKAQLVMKGFVDTSVLLKAVLAQEFGLRTANVLSHVAVIEVGSHDKLFYITDAAMNIAPDVTVKKQIIENALQVTRVLGNAQPRVACVCALEKVNPKMQATLDAAELVRMNQAGELTGCVVGGPFGLDNAVSLEAAKHKKITGPVAGNADILLVPSIEAGNMLYKSAVFFAQGQIAGIIVGAKVPVVLTSRADSDISKLYSIALGVLLAGRGEVPI